MEVGDFRHGILMPCPYYLRAHCLALKSASLRSMVLDGKIIVVVRVVVVVVRSKLNPMAFIAHKRVHVFLLSIFIFT